MRVKKSTLESLMCMFLDCSHTVTETRKHNAKGLKKVDKKD